MVELGQKQECPKCGPEKEAADEEKKNGDDSEK